MTAGSGGFEQIGIEARLERLRQFENDLKRMQTGVNRTARNLQIMEQRQAGVAKQSGRLERATQGVTRGLGKLAGGMVGQIASTVGVTLAIRAGISAFTDFESSFVGVTKTVDATEEQFETLEFGIRRTALEIPFAVEGLNALGEVAGQLGVEVKNLEAFTETAARLGVATVLGAEDAAIGLARFSAITGTAQEDIGRLGSSLVALGNTFETNEREILEMSLRLAASSKQFGLTEGDVLGLAAALSSVGIRADAGGTAFSRVMQEISKRSAEAGDGLDDLASLAGMTADEFQALVESDPGEALRTFIRSLADADAAGQNLFLILEDLQLTDQRLQRAVLGAVAAQDKFTDAMTLGNEAFAENTALVEESDKAFKTTRSTLVKFKSAVRELAAGFGESLKPAIETVTDLFLGFARAARQGVEIGALLRREVEELGTEAKALEDPLKGRIQDLHNLEAELGVSIIGFNGLISLSDRAARALREAGVPATVLRERVIALKDRVADLRGEFLASGLEFDTWAGRLAAADREAIGLVGQIRDLVDITNELLDTTTEINSEMGTIPEVFAELDTSMELLGDSERDLTVQTNNLIREFEAEREAAEELKEELDELDLAMRNNIQTAMSRAFANIGFAAGATRAQLTALRGGEEPGFFTAPDRPRARGGGGGARQRSAEELLDTLRQVTREAERFAQIEGTLRPLERDLAQFRDRGKDALAEQRRILEDIQQDVGRIEMLEQRLVDLRRGLVEGPEAEAVETAEDQLETLQQTINRRRLEILLKRRDELASNISADRRNQLLEAQNADLDTLVDSTRNELDLARANLQVQRDIFEEQRERVAVAEKAVAAELEAERELHATKVENQRALIEQMEEDFTAELERRQEVIDSIKAAMDAEDLRREAAEKVAAVEAAINALLERQGVLLDQNRAKAEAAARAVARAASARSAAQRERAEAVTPLPENSPRFDVNSAPPVPVGSTIVGVPVNVQSGPTVNVSATYPREVSPTSIQQDVRFILMGMP